MNKKKQLGILKKYLILRMRNYTYFDKIKRSKKTFL